MQVDIYINGQIADVSIDTEIAETKQVNDFFSLDDRQTSFTNVFKLPFTERNKAIFEAHGVPGITSLSAYRLHNIDIYRFGIPTLTGGIGYLKPTDEFYNLYVYSDNIDLFEAIGDKKISDLNLQAYNHSLNANTFLNSFGNTSGYVYAIADFGKTDPNNIEWNYQVPSIFVKTIWDIIFAEAGFKYRYNGRVDANNPYDPFTTEEWKEMAITLDSGLPYETGNEVIKKLELNKVGNSHFEAQYIDFFGKKRYTSKLQGYITEHLRFDIVEDPDNFSSYVSQTNRTKVRIKESGYYRLELSGVLYNTFTDGISLYVEKDGNILFTAVENESQEQINFGLTERLYFNAGEELFFKIVSLAIENKSIYGYEANIKLFKDNTQIAVNLSSFFTAISQKDFIKDVMWHFGLISRRNGDTYEMMAIEELLNPQARYPLPTDWTFYYDDWSDKFNAVLSRDTKVGNYGQKNIFAYKYDNANATYANGFLAVDDTTIEKERTLIERIYRAPDTSTLAINGILLRKCSLFEKEFNDDGSLKTVKPIKATPYLTRIKRQFASINYKETGAGEPSIYTGNIPFATFEEMDWSSILPKRYMSFLAMISLGQKIVAEMYLNVMDINQLDFFKLKYIKQEYGLFYLNKVSNYTGGDLVKCELIKIRAQDDLGEFSDDFNNDFKN